LLKKTLRLML